MALIHDGTNQQPVPGIIVADRAPEQTARIAGTGIEVFEVLKAYRALGEDLDKLREAFHWLNEEQLRAALAYAEQHQAALAVRLAEEEEAAITARLRSLWETHPATAPTER
jgi:uncharacterized protein (DUF433 family)